MSTPERDSRQRRGQHVIKQGGVTCLCRLQTTNRLVMLLTKHKTAIGWRVRQRGQITNAMVWNLNVIRVVVTLYMIKSTMPVLNLHEFSSNVPNNISTQDNISAQQC